MTGWLYMQCAVPRLISSTSVVARGCVKFRCGAVTGFTSLRDGNFFKRSVFKCNGSLYWQITVWKMVKGHWHVHVSLLLLRCAVHHHVVVYVHVVDVGGMVHVL